MIAWLRWAWRILFPQKTAKSSPIALPDTEIDWFVWESEQIQRNGYAPWFDHWRYEGQDDPYPDPTPQQLRTVFLMSQDLAIARYGKERVLRTLAENIPDLEVDEDMPAYRRSQAMGQDPVAWAMKKNRRR